MQFYKFICPSNWTGHRDIDEIIDVDKINMEQNFEGVEDVDGENNDDKSISKDTKSKSEKDKKSKKGGDKDSKAESSKKKKK